MNFNEMLTRTQAANDSLISAGLDECVTNRPLIAETATEACAYKLDVGAYRGEAHNGLLRLRANIYLIRQCASGIPIIHDGKYGGTAKANEGNAKEAFEQLKVDAVTAHGWMGGDSLKPFLEHKDKMVFVVCKSSNDDPSGIQDQMVQCPGQPHHHIPAWQYIAIQVAEKWNRYGNCGLVIGAMHPSALKWVRTHLGDDLIILSPGGGKYQGGDIKEATEAGVNSRGENLIMHFTREFERVKTPGERARELRLEVNKYRQKGKEAAQ